MIILLDGPDTYRSRARLRDLVSGFQKKYDPAGTSVVRFAGRGIDPTAVGASLGAVGLFTTKRLIVFEGLSAEAAAASRDAVLALLTSKAGTDDIVILWEPGEAKKSRRTTKLKVPKKREGAAAPNLEALATKHETFALLSGLALERWVDEAMKSRGASFESAAKAALIVAVGPDLWRMTSELDKLAAAADSRPITVSDVRALVVDATLDPIFAFTDALGSRNVASALGLLEEQRASGAADLYLVAVIARQLKLLIVTKEMQSEGADAISASFGYHPFAVRKAASQASRFTLPELTGLLQRLVRLDLALKTTPHAPAVLLTQFVVAVCKARRT